MLTLEQVMKKSIDNINGLHEVLVEATKVLIENCYDKGIQIRIVQGLRTIAYQNDLYAQGRTQAELNKVGLSNVTAKPSMQKVTNAIGGTSFHNHGVAIDFCLLLPDGKNVTWDMNTDYNGNNVKDWVEVVDEAKKLGFKWGGDWTSFKDYPHFEMTFGLTTTNYRNGNKPTQKQIDTAYEVINKYKKVVEIPMTTAEKIEFDKLVVTVSQQAELIKKLQGKSAMTDIPVWAVDACVAAKNAKLVDTTANGSYDFYRLLTILYRKGII